MTGSDETLIWLPMAEALLAFGNPDTRSQLQEAQTVLDRKYLDYEPPSPLSWLRNTSERIDACRIHEHEVLRIDGSGPIFIKMGHKLIQPLEYWRNKIKLVNRPKEPSPSTPLSSQTNHGQV